MSPFSLVSYEVVSALSSPGSLRPLVVGGGTMGQLHVRALLSRADIASLVLVDPDAERSAHLTRQYGRIEPFTSLASALAEHTFDFAVVAVPVGVACEVIEAVMRRGVPVLAEKPLAASAMEARHLAQLAKELGALLSVGYIERFNPAVAALRSELDRGSAGRIYHIHARRLSPFPYRSGMAGVALDVATHDLDVSSYVIGSLPTRVYAETDAREGTSGEDLLCASLRYANGVTGLIESNWVTPTKVRRLTVTTERGMFDVDYLTQDLWFYERASGDAEWEALGVMRGANEGRTIRYALNRREPLAIEHERFIDAARTGGAAPVPADDAVNTLIVAEAIIESGRTQLPVAFDDVLARRPA